MKNEENNECRKIWEALGPWWDASVEDGDYFHRAFVFPGILKFLDLHGGELVLDAGCGNGALSRYMTQNGAEVFGVDFSSTLIQQAKQRSPAITYEIMDLTDVNALKNLGQQKKFDRIASSMVLHDMSDVRPFFESLQFLLKSEGYFIFSIPHPCFNSPSVLFEPEEGITIKSYIKPETFKMKSKPGQPIEQMVFHRPIQEYVNLLAAQGFVMDGFVEPCVDPKLLPEHSIWAKRPEIPPALISRWKHRK